MGKREMLFDGCRPDMADENGVFPCFTKFQDRDGRMWAVKEDNPVRVKMLRDEKPIIMSSGGLPSDVVERLISYLSRNRVT